MLLKVGGVYVCASELRPCACAALLALCFGSWNEYGMSCVCA